MPADLRAMFPEGDPGLPCRAGGQKATEDFKVNGQYVNSPEKGVVGIPFFASMSRSFA